MPMIPSIPYLMAFEAVARHASFSRAGEELCITQSAVSHRVRMLEEQLGLALFRRSTRSLALTLAGQRYLPVVQNALQGLEHGTAAVRRTRGHAKTLQLLVTRAIASTWLVPRLDDLAAEVPGLEVSIVTHNSWLAETDLDRYEFDAAIFIAHDDAHLRGLPRTRLVEDFGVPVCHPLLMKASERLKDPGDLRHHILLHAQTCPDVWQRWLSEAGFEDLTPKADLRMDHTGMTVQAAINGLGVAIAHGPLIARHIASGSLTMPFGERRIILHPGCSYYCVWQHELGDCPEVIAFRSWAERSIGETLGGRRGTLANAM
jgi:LysR family transcriptional regulator, glycine cleavage system transcriptional activator